MNRFIKQYRTFIGCMVCYIFLGTTSLIPLPPLSQTQEPFGAFLSKLTQWQTANAEKIGKKINYSIVKKETDEDTGVEEDSENGETSETAPIDQANYQKIIKYYDATNEVQKPIFGHEAFTNEVVLTITEGHNSEKLISKDKNSPEVATLDTLLKTYLEALSNTYGYDAKAFFVIPEAQSNIEKVEFNKLDFFSSIEQIESVNIISEDKLNRNDIAKESFVRQLQLYIKYVCERAIKHGMTKNQKNDLDFGEPFSCSNLAIRADLFPYPFDSANAYEDEEENEYVTQTHVTQGRHDYEGWALANLVRTFVCKVRDIKEDESVVDATLGLFHSDNITVDNKQKMIKEFGGLHGGCNGPDYDGVSFENYTSDSTPDFEAPVKQVKQIKGRYDSTDEGKDKKIERLKLPDVIKDKPIYTYLPKFNYLQAKAFTVLKGPSGLAAFIKGRGELYKVGKAPKRRLLYMNLNQNFQQIEDLDSGTNYNDFFKQLIEEPQRITQFWAGTFKFVQATDPYVQPKLKEITKATRGVGVGSSVKAIVKNNIFYNQYLSKAGGEQSLDLGYHFNTISMGWLTQFFGFTNNAFITKTKKDKTKSIETTPLFKLFMGISDQGYTYPALVYDSEEQVLYDVATATELIKEDLKIEGETPRGDSMMFVPPLLNKALHEEFSPETIHMFPGPKLSEIKRQSSSSRYPKSQSVTPKRWHFPLNDSDMLLGAPFIGKNKKATPFVGISGDKVIDAMRAYNLNIIQALGRQCMISGAFEPVLQNVKDCMKEEKEFDQNSDPQIVAGTKITPDCLALAQEQTTAKSHEQNFCMGLLGLMLNQEANLNTRQCSDPDRSYEWRPWGLCAFHSWGDTALTVGVGALAIVGILGVISLISLASGNGFFWSKKKKKKKRKGKAQPPPKPDDKKDDKKDQPSTQPPTDSQKDLQERQNRAEDARGETRTFPPRTLQRSTGTTRPTTSPFQQEQQPKSPTFRTPGRFQFGQ